MNKLRNQILISEGPGWLVATVHICYEALVLFYDVWSITLQKCQELQFTNYRNPTKN